MLDQSRSATGNWSEAVCTLEYKVRASLFEISDVLLPVELAHRFLLLVGFHGDERALENGF